MDFGSVMPWPGDPVKPLVSWNQGFCCPDFANFIGTQAFYFIEIQVRGLILLGFSGLVPSGTLILEIWPHVSVLQSCWKWCFDVSLFCFLDFRSINLGFCSVFWFQVYFSRNLLGLCSVFSFQLYVSKILLGFLISSVFCSFLGFC